MANNEGGIGRISQEELEQIRVDQFCDDLCDTNVDLNDWTQCQPLVTDLFKNISPERGIDFLISVMSKCDLDYSDFFAFLIMFCFDSMKCFKNEKDVNYFNKQAELIATQKKSHHLPCISSFNLEQNIVVLYHNCMRLEQTCYWKDFGVFPRIRSKIGGMTFPN